MENASIHSFQSRTDEWVCFFPNLSKDTPNIHFITMFCAFYTELLLALLACATVRIIIATPPSKVCISSCRFCVPILHQKTINGMVATSLRCRRHCDSRTSILRPSSSSEFTKRSFSSFILQSFIFVRREEDIE